MFQLLVLDQVPIFQQLQLEEALLRVDSGNWCLINTGSTPAIVMGISGKPEKLIDLSQAQNDRIPIIKRFSGGGTVYIDPETVFITWICSQSILDSPLQPKPILEWSEKIYQPLFKGFCLKENDYSLAEKKFGGNALYIQKSRWLLHSSLLWDYEITKMNRYLLMPEKCPEYRQKRSHCDFLCPLKNLYPTKKSLVDTLIHHIQNSFPTTPIHPPSLLQNPFPSHRQATQLLEVIYTIS